MTVLDALLDARLAESYSEAKHPRDLRGRWTVGDRLRVKGRGAEGGIWKITQAHPASPHVELTSERSGRKQMALASELATNFERVKKSELAKSYDAGRAAQATRAEILAKSPSAAAELRSYKNVKSGAKTEKLTPDKSIDGHRTHDGYTLRRSYAPATGNAGRRGESGSTIYGYDVHAPDGARIGSTAVLRSTTTQQMIDRHRAKSAAAAALPPEHEYADLLARARQHYERTRNGSTRLLINAADTAIRDIRAGRKPSDFTLSQIKRYRGSLG